MKIKKIISIILIRYKNRKQFSIFKKVSKLGLEISLDKNNKLLWNNDDSYSKVLIVLLGKNLHRLESLMLLCKYGLAKDAIPLLRSMFEELVDIKYIKADKERLKDYLDYDTHIRLKLRKFLLNNKYQGIDKEKIQARIMDLEKEWNIVKGRFLNKNGKICTRWTCRNVADISAEVGLKDPYQFMFGYLSNFIHSNTISANHYVLGRNGNNIVIEIGSSQQFISEVLITASALFLDILSIINTEYKMELDQKLKNLSDKVEKMRTTP